MVDREDRRGNLYPTKQRPEQKIDAAMTTIMGIARCLAARAPGSRYNDPATRSSPFLDVGLASNCF